MKESERCQCKKKVRDWQRPLPSSYEGGNDAGIAAGKSKRRITNNTIKCNKLRESQIRDKHQHLFNQKIQKVNVDASLAMGKS